jgi:multidrug transporter EmrE-like cation transporter
MRAALLLLAVLSLTVYAQLIIKSRALAHAGEHADRLGYLVSMMTDLFVLSGIVAVFIAGLYWILTIEVLDLGFAYPFMALSFVLVPLGALVFFREPVPPLLLLGLALIVVGIGVSAVAKS